MTINYLRLAGLLSILLFGIVHESHAQTECDPVLTKDLQINNTTSSKRQQASFNYACSHDFQEFNDTYGGSASGKYAGIAGSGAYNGNYKKFQSDHCAGATSSDHQSGFQYYTLRDASAGGHLEKYPLMV